MDRPGKIKLTCAFKIVSWALIGVCWLAIVIRGVGRPGANSLRPTRAKAFSLAIENLTQSLTVSSIEPIGEFRQKITLRNDSSKTVECFAYSLEPINQIDTRRGTIGLGMLPGATISEKIDLKAQIDKGRENLTLTVMAVVFEDGSGEGLPRAERTLVDQQLGTEIGHLAVAPIMESLPDHIDAGFPAIARVLKERLRGIPPLPDTTPFEVRHCAQDATALAANEIDDVERVYAAYGESLTERKVSEVKKFFTEAALHATTSVSVLETASASLHH